MIEIVHLHILQRLPQSIPLIIL